MACKNRVFVKPLWTEDYSADPFTDLTAYNNIALYHIEPLDGAESSYRK